MAQSAPLETANLIRYQNEQIDRFRTNLSLATEDGAPEAVHNLRVASRRLKALLRLLHKCGGGKRLVRVRRSLDRARRLFRRVRDLDVLQDSLKGAEGLEMIDPQAFAEIDLALTARRERLCERARHHAANPKLRKELRLLDELGDSSLLIAGVDPLLLKDTLSKEFRRQGEGLARMDPWEGTTDLHEIRIAVKGTRYCAQLLKECDCIDLGELMAALAQMQRLLGGWSDHVVATKVIARFADRRKAISTRTALSVRLLEYAASRARAAIDARQRMLDGWPGLVAVLNTALSELSRNEESSGPAGAENEPAVTMEGGT